MRAVAPVLNYGIDFIRLLGRAQRAARAERDLSAIAAAYQRMYGKPLLETIKSETHGELERLLATVVERSVSL